MRAPRKEGSVMKNEKVWDCKIGVIGELALPMGADLPMRQAIERAFKEITGRDPEFIFSGWGGSLTDVERQIVEERGPGTDRAHFVGFDNGGRSGSA
jgi:hypothetical protein